MSNITTATVMNSSEILVFSLQKT